MKKQIKESLQKEKTAITGLILAVFIAITGILCGQFVKGKEIEQAENSRNYTVIKKEKSVIFFYRDNCPDCQKIFAQVYNASKKRSIQFVNTNNQENRDAYLKKYQIQYVPTFVLTDKYGKEVGRYIGTDKKKIEQILSESK